MDQNNTPERGTVCEVCEALLTEENSLPLDPRNTISVCKEHQSSSQTNQLWLTKKKLGFKYEQPKNCRFCPAELTDEEIASVTEDHYSVTCNNHRDGATFINPDMYATPEFKKEYILKFKPDKNYTTRWLDICVSKMLTKIIQKSIGDNPFESFASISELIEICRNMFDRNQILDIFLNNSKHFSMCLISLDVAEGEEQSSNDKIGLRISEINFDKTNKYASIPKKYETIITGALRFQIATFEQFVNMDEYQLLDYCAQMEQYAFVKEMMKSKSVKDLLQDMEIKGLIDNQLQYIKSEHSNAVELLTYIESSK